MASSLSCGSSKLSTSDCLVGIHTDTTVPSLSDTISYNPFKVDIHQLGYTILEVVSVSGVSSSKQPHFDLHYDNQEYRDLPMFKPLADAMMSAAPGDRPTASSALAQFESIASSIKRQKLRTRIWRKSDTLLQRFLRTLLAYPLFDMATDSSVYIFYSYSVFS
jgi:hypothetical protein